MHFRNIFGFLMLLWVSALPHDAGPLPLGDGAMRDSSAAHSPLADTVSARTSSAISQDTMVVVGRRPVSAFNSSTIMDRDLSLRVMTADPADVIKVTPGLFTGQHAGGGKANQYFIRGFDCDHGTDLAIWFDGMPINEVSHGHGQGYADLHFIIPELVDKVQVNKGPYDIEYGDFATAASVSMGTRKNVSENEAFVYGGMFNTIRALDILSLNFPMKPIIATEVYRSDGPFDNPERMERYNIFFKTPLLGTSGSNLDLTLMGYGAGWNASGQVPLRAIDSGWVGLYGSEDPSEGGNSQRYSASLNYVCVPDVQNELKATAYLINYRLSLFSDFTFYDVDTLNGDEINQRDDRTTAGFHSSYKHRFELSGMPASAQFGVETRDDLIHNFLDHADKRQIIGHFQDDNIDEGSLSAYYLQSVTPFPWLYVEAGLRGDHFGVDVVDNLHKDGDSCITGNKDASMYSPKLNIVFTPFEKTDIYLNYGEGFHSNDARGVTTRDIPALSLAPATLLVKARGYEGGARTHLWDRLDVAASLWLIDLESELVWNGDVGGTSPSGATERKGVDVSARYQVLSWLWADFDITKNTAEFRGDAGNANSVALAPLFTATGGLSMRLPSGFYGSLRLQHLDDRPGDQYDSLTAKGFTVLDLGAGYRYKRWEFVVNVGNLTNTRWYTAQFETTSRIRNPQGVLGPETTNMDVVPGAPINVKGGVKFYF